MSAHKELQAQTVARLRKQMEQYHTAQAADAPHIAVAGAWGEMLNHRGLPAVRSPS